MESRWRLVVLSAALALAAVGLISSGLRPRPGTTELTYWDGAAADEPGYAEEAANQVDSGTYAAHVGFFERPGYWNNRAVADQGESEMDARMFSDASDRKNWETAGTDFMDTDSLYSESQDDMDDIMGSEYANSWPGTGANLYGWQDIAEDSDGYDGQWAVQPLDMEATDDAAVSQNDFAGYKAVGASRFQTLSECDGCDSGTDCVSGCRVSSVHARQDRARKRAPSSMLMSEKQKARLTNDDEEMADLNKILHPQNRFLVNRLVDKVIKTGGHQAMLNVHAAHTGNSAGTLATRQMKVLSSLVGDDKNGSDEADDDVPQQVEQTVGDGWFLGCNPGPGFSGCLRQSVRSTSQELTPEVRPFYNKRQMNAGCKTGPGFSGCIVDNLDLNQPNYQKDGYWPILDDANSDFLQNDKGLNVDSWWDKKADAGASVATLTERRDSKSAQDDYAIKSIKTQSLRFVPGVGMVPRHSLRAPPRAAAPATAAKGSMAFKEQQQVLSAADAALASAANQLSVESAQKEGVLALAHKRAQQQAMLRKLEGKKVVLALDGNKPLNLKQQQDMLVNHLNFNLKDKNFKTSGYLPFSGNSHALQGKGINVNGQQLRARDMNFKRKGYWPLNGNTRTLQQHGVEADQWGDDVPGRNWHANGYFPVTAGNSYLGGKGVKVVGTPLDEPAMPEQHIDTSSLGGWWKTVMGNGKKLSKLGIHVDTWQGTEAHPNKLASLGVNR